MKKKFCMTTLTAMLAGGACAETGVTLFGVIDTGMEVLNNAPDANGKASRRSHLNSGNLWGSRWGLRGREDLGDGLQAIFHLESGFSSDTGAAGQNGRLFGRGAYVGLAGKSHRVTLGRRNNTLFDYMYPFDPMGMATYSTLTHDPVLAGRADNAVRYDGQFRNLEMSGLYSFGYDGSVKDGGEMAGAPRIGRELGLGLKYAPGALAFGMAYDQRHGNSHASQRRTDKRLAAAVSYSSGAVVSYFGYRWFASNAPDMASRASNLYWSGLKYQLTPAFSLAGMGAYTDTRDSAADPLTFSLLGTYDLSKRSSLYLLGSYASNRGGSSLGVGGFDEQIVSGSNQSGVIAGILHQF